MSPEERKAIASKGGQASHASGKAHRWDQQAAVEAARKSVKRRRQSS